MIAAIVLKQYNVIPDTQWKELALKSLLVVTAALAGWIFCFPGSNNRLTLSMITGMRNMSLSMGIAVTAFPGSPAMTTILAYSFVAGTGMLAYAYAARRTKSKT
ncbi:MAG: hypothetical protein EOM90_11855 [Alphaproteobacteria bacterium]|nr:hypothetical protein [Alphaproteobacteria bacterium]